MFLLAPPLIVLLILCAFWLKSAWDDPLNHGWKRLAYEPLEGAVLLLEAQDSNCVWRVDRNSGNGRVTITRGAQFATRHQKEVRLQTEAGTLVGTDHGEWGGGLALIDAQGATPKPILGEGVKPFLGENVVQLLPVKSGVRVLTGLRHLDFDKGAIWLYEKDGSGDWSIKILDDLDAMPDFAIISGSDILVVDGRGISRFDQAGGRKGSVPVLFRDLGPISVAEDARGRIYFGMKAFVVRLVRSTSDHSGYVQEWFTKQGCLP
jgi:hypothetical protein